MNEIALYAIIGIETAIIAVAVFYLARFSMTLIRFQEEIEKSLDSLDERYRSISKVLEIPLFYDSPEVRRVVEDVRACRESILQVAQKLGRVEEEES
jgi:hypothetical protein